MHPIYLHQSIHYNPSYYDKGFDVSHQNVLIPYFWDCLLLGLKKGRVEWLMLQPSVSVGF